MQPSALDRIQKDMAWLMQFNTASATRRGYGAAVPRFKGLSLEGTRVGAGAQRTSGCRGSRAYKGQFLEGTEGVDLHAARKLSEGPWHRPSSKERWTTDGQRPSSSQKWTMGKHRLRKGTHVYKCILSLPDYGRLALQ
jgi:hypothetical protein